MKPFDFFDEIFCINLDRRADRWELAQKEFNKLGILNKVTRFSAIENAHAEKGCFESHLQCIFSAKERGLNNVLIFEDDVAFLPCYSEKKLIKSMELLHEKDDWEFFYLGGFERRVKPRPLYNKLKKKWSGDFNPSFDYLMECKSVGWAQSYAVRSCLFEKIHEDYNNGLWDIVNKKYNGKTGGADKYYQDILQPKAYMCVPSFTSQYDIVSDLSRTHTNKSLRISIDENQS
jgi:GR25 family glycosyltransferase involved in LPS biosynthesis